MPTFYLLVVAAELLNNSLACKHHQITRHVLDIYLISRVGLLFFVFSRARASFSSFSFCLLCALSCFHVRVGKVLMRKRRKKKTQRKYFILGAHHARPVSTRAHWNYKGCFHFQHSKYVDQMR